MQLSLSLIVDEEEGLVLLERSTQRATELVQVELFPLAGEIAACVQRGVAEEFKYCSVKRVRSRLGGDQNGRARARTIFGGIVIAENLEFLDGIDRRQNGNSASGQFIVVVAIEQPVGAAGARSAH